MTPTTVTAGAAGFAISESVAVDPTGRFLFVAWELEDVVDVYAIEPVTGGLTLVESQFSGNAPAQVVVDPLGRFVYVVNLNPSGVDTVAGFRLAGNGALTPVSTLSHTSAARGAVVDPPGRFLVVGFSAGPSPVHVYAIDPGTGALSFVMSNGGVPPASAVAIGRHGAVRLRRARRERGDREVDAGPGRRRADHGTRTPHER